MAYVVSFSHAELPPVMGSVINVSLTVPETIFASFVRSLIEKNLAQGFSLFLIGSKNIADMQEKFSEYTFKVFKYKAQPEEVNLIPLINSVWNKSRRFIDDELKLNKNVEALEDEKKLMAELKIQEPSHFAQGYQGRLFTKRQSEFFVKAVEAFG